MAILNPKVRASGLVDVLGIGISKQLTERALAPVIGNGTLMSGAIKLVAGGIVQGQGRYGNIIGSGLVVDGVEDIVVSFLGKSGASNEAAGW